MEAAVVMWWERERGQERGQVVRLVQVAQAHRACSSCGSGLQRRSKACTTFSSKIGRNSSRSSRSSLSLHRRARMSLQAWASLRRLMALPAETTVYCAHEARQQSEQNPSPEGVDSTTEPSTRGGRLYHRTLHQRG